MLPALDPCIPSKPTIELFWELESLGIMESHSTSDAALDQFNNTVKFVDGRHMVTWPRKEKNADLPENYQLAFGRHTVRTYVSLQFKVSQASSVILAVRG